MTKRTGKFYSKNEKKIMESLGLTPTKMSGGGWIEKEDGYNDYILCQHKSTDANSYRLTREDFRKLEYHALVEKKMPLFVVEFLSDGELYLIIKPEDLTSIVNHIELPKGSLEVKSELLEDIQETPKKKTTKVIKSGNKNRYWDNVAKEKEKKYGNGKR